MADQQTATSEPAKGGMMGKILVVGFMGTVILIESALAYLLIPSADDIAARAEQRKQEQLEETKKKAEGTEKISEVDLGRYGISARQTGKNLTVRIDFHLYGTVLDEDKSDFDDIYKRNEHRFRDQILVEFRNATLTELHDPMLVLIKRRILEKSNALLGKNYLQSIVFSEFSLIEQ